MNILILFGSPKRTGHTQKLLDAFLNGLKKPYHLQYARVFDMMPIPCNDCGYCKRAKGCSKKDLDTFMENYFQADFIIVASPIYLYSMPAPLKALFDRFQRFFNARFSQNIKTPIDKQKKAALLLTAGSNGAIGQRIIEEQVKTAFSVMNTTLITSILLGNTDQYGSQENILNKATETAKKISAERRRNI